MAYTGPLRWRQYVMLDDEELPVRVDGFIDGGLISVRTDDGKYRRVTRDDIIWACE